METGSTSRGIAALVLLLGLCIGSALGAVSSMTVSTAAQPPAIFPWPVQFSAGADSAVIYPPELNSVRDGQVEGTLAVAVRTGEDARPRFGIVHFQARVQPDPGDAAASTVVEFQASQLDFPSEPERAAELLGQIQAALSGVKWRTSQRRLQEAISVVRAQNRARNVPLRNEAPRILFSERPAVLVTVDGAPALRDVPGSALRRVVNTRALILVEPTGGRYYLRLLGNWFVADQIDGPWSLSLTVPSEVGRAKDELAQTDTVDLLEPSGDTGGAESEASPVPVVSTVPAELILTEGPAQWGAIPDTELLYVTNTASSVFYDLRGQAYYVVLSGRWYRSAAFPSSDWQYVAADRLPADFARVPQGHPTEAVRAAVAGTPEAREAQIATEVPQTAVVQRSTTKLDLTYDGPPRFAPIPGTSLESAVNANTPVIRVSAYAYYALQNGVWFSSITGTDGWKVADWVPPEIYSIPPDSPLHYVTYVRVYEATPSDVYVGYTPGYLGWYDGGSTVVYGTGWGYQPWIGSAWYPWPGTWGCGCCSPWWGPCFGFGFYYGGWWGWPWPVYVPYFPAHVHPPHGHPPMFPSHLAGVGPAHVGRVGHSPVIVVRGTGNTVNVNNVYGHWGSRLPVTPTSPSLAPRWMHPGGSPPAATRAPSVAAVAPAPSSQPAWSRPGEAGRIGGASGWAPPSPRSALPAGGWAPSVHPAPPMSGAAHGPATMPRTRIGPWAPATRGPPAMAAPMRSAPAPAQPPMPSGWARPWGGYSSGWRPPAVSGPAPGYHAPAPAFNAAPQVPFSGHAAGSTGAPSHAPAGGARSGGGRGRR